MTSIVDLVEISTFSFFVSEHPKPKEVTGKTKFVFIGLGEPASLSTWMDQDVVPSYSSYGSRKG